MLAIKLKRIGKKHQASYRVLISEKRSKLDGKYIEDIGWFNPHTDELKIDSERVKYWLGVGAQPTLRVKNLLKKIHSS